MTIVSTVAIVVALLALWITRAAWRSPWERPALINVVLQTFDLLVVMRTWNYRLSSNLHTLTGVWKLEELIGHLCYFLGMQTLLFLVVSRLDMTRAQFRSFVRYRIEIPGTMTIALMIALFCCSRVAKRYVPDTIAAKDGPWMRVYWMVLAAAVSCILLQIYHALMILREDPRSRRAANAYLFAIAINAACVVVSVFGFEYLRWLLVRAEVIAYAIAATYSWRIKQRADVPSDYLLPG